MEQFLAALFAELLKYGAPGVAIGYLIVMILRREKTIEAKDAELKAVMEKRVNEAIASTLATSAIAQSNEKLVEVVDRFDASQAALGEKILTKFGEIDDTLREVSGILAVLKDRIQRPEQ